MRFLFPLFLVFFLASCQETERKTHDQSATLASKIDSIILNNQFNGVVLLKQRSNVLFSGRMGYSDLEKRTLLSPYSQFVIGSVSKQITAVLVLREVEKGTIKLDDKIAVYLPQIDQSWKSDVTVHQLLTHTHGIVALDERLKFPPGSQFDYSQLGYQLLAELLESVTQKSFQTISTELFQEFKLTETFHPDNRLYQHLVKGYEEDENGTLKFVTSSLDNYAAAGSFISTTEDLARWNQLLHAGKLIKKETLKQMKTNYATRDHPIFGGIEYGYGLLFKDGESDQQIGALGYADGFASACYFYPKSELSLVILSNTARDLDDFKLTFKTHVDIMNVVKNYAQNFEN